MKRIAARNILRHPLLLLALVPVLAFGAPFAERMPFTQPDGSRIELWGEGDEFYAVFETLQGYTVVFDPALKAYCYARLALDGGSDGLEFYRRLAAQAASFLKPEGRIMLEFGDGQADDLSRIFEARSWIVEAVRPDYSKRTRIFIARRG